MEVIRLNLEWEGHQVILMNFEDLRPRLRALYQMTGGNPRLTVMLYEMIANESVTKVQDQFHLLLDRITPFYQGRLNDLAPGQRALLECLASMRDQEKTPAAIAAQMRMSQQETSSLLKRLTDAHYLRASEHPQDKRSRLYTIREGFFDIWLAMNLSRGARKRLPFLLEFFELFYPSVEDREEKRLQLRETLIEEGSIDAKTALDYLSEVGEKGEKAAAKFDMARISARRGDADQMISYVLEAAPLAGDGVSQSIARIVKSNASAPDYLGEIAEMIECWQLHRSGELEQFAKRLNEIGEGLTLRTFSQAKFEFLRDALESTVNREERIIQRLRIANVLMDLTRWKECERQQRLALAEAEELANPMLVARASSDLAQLLHETNRLGEAEPLMRRALEIDETALGRHHPDVAIRLNSLARLLVATSRFSEAEPLYRRALKITEAALGRHHHVVAIRLNNLAALLWETDRFEEAEPMMRRAVEISEAAHGTHHPDTAIRLNNLAGLLQATNQFSEAEPLFRRALEISEATYGRHHPAVADCLNNLAGLLKVTNRLGESERLFGRALAIDEAAHGKFHPLVANRLNNLAHLLMAINRLEEAEPLMRRAFDILYSFRQQTGHEHPQYSAVKTNYQALRHAMGLD